MTCRSTFIGPLDTTSASQRKPKSQSTMAFAGIDKRLNRARKLETSLLIAFDASIKTRQALAR
jgi:hypothetical protein